MSSSVSVNVVHTSFLARLSMSLRRRAQLKACQGANEFYTTRYKFLLNIIGLFRYFMRVLSDTGEF